MKLRVMTWNVHAYLGTGGAHNPERTLATLEALAPDIVALQEVEGRDRGHGIFDGIRHIRALGYRDIVEAITISDQSGRYGHVLASRWPIVRETTHDISVEGYEPRRLIDAEVDLPGGRLRVLTSHFGLRASERRRQIVMLAKILEDCQGLPTVVMGDFNDWRRRGWLHRVLGPCFGTAKVPATFPAYMPALPLDRIWGRPARLIRRVWTAPESRRVSDHLPLLAELEWPPGTPAA